MKDLLRPSRLARFGDFEVDLEAGELRKGGLRIRLQQQPFQILTLLLERQGHVVTREELQKLLWPNDTIVEFEHSINAAINRLREARAASALDHPNICTLYDIGEDTGRPFIVMPLLQGQTLKQMLRVEEGSALPSEVRRTPLPTDTLLGLAVQIADALATAHAKGIIHRDIKPGNVFVTESGQAKILDFGLAKLLHERPTETSDSRSPELVTPSPAKASSIHDSITQTGVAVGTPAYMSPEQVRGEELDTRTDLFSLGAVLYEMAAGRQPFAGDAAAEVERAIESQSPSPASELNPDLPAKLEEIILKGLEKNREQRYQSAADLREGDFGEICAPGSDSNGMCLDEEGQLWDPYSGVYVPELGGPVRNTFIPFNNLATYQSPGNPKLDGTGFQLPAVPGNLIDPVAYKIMQFYPLPNLGVATPEYDRFNNWIGSGVNKGANNQWDLKIDHRFGGSDSLSGKFSWGRTGSRGASCFANVADPCAWGQWSDNSRVFALNYVHTFGPSTLLNLSFGVARLFGFDPGQAADFPDFDPVTTLGMPDYIKRSGIVAAPAIYIGEYGLAGGASIGMQGWRVAKTAVETHQVLASLNRVQGSHELKFGGEMRLHRVNHFQAGYPAGEFGFTYGMTSQYPWWGGGDDMAGFLTGGDLAVEMFTKLP